MSVGSRPVAQSFGYERASEIPGRRPRARANPAPGVRSRIDSLVCPLPQPIPENIPPVFPPRGKGSSLSLPCMRADCRRTCVCVVVRVVVGKVKIGPHIARGCSWSVHFRFCCCFWPLFFKTVDLGIVMPARPLGRRGRTGESQAKMAMATRRTPSDPRARCTTEHRPAARAPALDRNINITSFAVPFSQCFAQTGGEGGQKSELKKTTLVPQRQARPGGSQALRTHTAHGGGCHCARRRKPII